MKRFVGSGLVALALCGSAVAGITALAAPPTRQHGGVGHAAAQGYLGIDVRDVSDEQIPVLKLKDAHGAEIIRVDHDGPAGKMGLREHDVVVQMNGSAIDGEDQIRRMLRETAPGRTVALTIYRDGEKLTLTAQMANRTEVERQAWELHLAVPPPQPPPAGVPSEEQAAALNPAATAAPVPSSKSSKGFLSTLLPSPSYTGLMLERIGPQLAQFFGVPRGSGLLVKNVDRNSPAEMAGVKAGDVVLRADTKAVGTMTDWTKAVREAKGRPVTVVVLRDKQEKTVTVTPDSKKRGAGG
jgi:serine protease Do